MELCPSEVHFYPHEFHFKTPEISLRYNKDVRIANEKQKKKKKVEY